MGIRQILCSVVILLLCHIGLTYGDEINIYTYHNHPPFVIDAIEKGRGLTFDLEDSINRYSEGKISFAVEVLPRNRLNMKLNSWISGDCFREGTICQNNWMVIWVNPKWGFGNNAASKFHWIRIHDDSNAMISSQKNKIAYHSPISLKGLRFGGMRGHRYIGIDKLVRQKKIIRIDGNRERDNILKLLTGRVDVILLPTSTINYYIEHDKKFVALDQKLYVAPNKHQVFARYVMIPKSNQQLYHQVKAFMAESKDWQLLLQQAKLL